LLLSACINPKGMPDAILDVKRRISDYKAALNYYITNHQKVSRIVFVENSGWPLDEIRKVSEVNPYGKELEFVSLDMNDYPREFGKGWGEHHLIGSALELSALALKTRYVAKMTGRIFLSNISQILQRIRGPIELLCDFRDHPLYEWLHLPYPGRYCDTRFIVFTKEFFQINLSMLSEYHIAGQFSMEENYYRAIKPLERGNTVICRFPVEPKYRGIAGHGSKNYSSTKEITKQTVRGLCRKICPFLRI